MRGDIGGNILLEKECVVEEDLDIRLAGKEGGSEIRKREGTNKDVDVFAEMHLRMGFYDALECRARV